MRWLPGTRAANALLFESSMLFHITPQEQTLLRGADHPWCANKITRDGKRCSQADSTVRTRDSHEGAPGQSSASSKVRGRRAEDRRTEESR